jgi:hypothetical protein
MPDRLVGLFSVFARVPGVCTGIKRTISADLRIDQDECSNSLNEELLRYTRVPKREAGIDAKARQRAIGLLDEVEGITKCYAIRRDDAPVYDWRLPPPAPEPR